MMMKAIDADGRGREEHFLPAMQACTHAEVKAQEAVSLIKYTCSSDWRCFIMQKILMLGSVLFLPRPQLKIIQHPAFQHVDFDALMINKKLCKSGTVKTEASMPPPPPLPSSCQSSAPTPVLLTVVEQYRDTASEEQGGVISHLQMTAPWFAAWAAPCQTHSRASLGEMAFFSLKQLGMMEENKQRRLSSRVSQATSS